MTTAASATLTNLERRRSAISTPGWAAIAVLGLLFVLVHGAFLERLFRIVTNARGETLPEAFLSALSASWNPDWAHALVIPFISAFCVYLKREEIAATPRRVCFWGLPILLAGLLSYVFWVHPGRNDMLQGYSMIVGLFGLVLFLLGPAMMRHLWFPIAYLVFAVKISDRLWDALALHLQQVAAEAATVALQFFTLVLNFEVDNKGNTIVLLFMENGIRIERELNVAEACSGLRSLMAFVALGVALAFLWDRAWWQRLVMIAMAVPIAIGVNVGRVTALGLLSLVDEKYTKGDFHTMIGMLMLIPAAFLFLGLGWVLDRILIREEDEGAPPPDAGRGAEPGVLAAGAEPPPQPRKATIAGGWMFLAGVTAAVLAGGLYLLMLRVPAPQAGFIPVQLVQLAVNMAIKMAVLVAPAALVGMAVAWAAWRVSRLLRERGAGSLIPASALVAGVLVTVFVGQQVAIARSGLVLIKLPVPLKHPLVLIPSEVGPWKMVHEDPPLPPEILEALGTDKYISRVYEDTTWPASQPGRLVRLHVAYYTGTTDTVPHVPDRCFVANGVAGVAKGLTTIELEGDFRPDPEHGGYLVPVTMRLRNIVQPPARVPAREFDVTYFTFTEPQSRRTDNVLYFFAANGKFLPTPDFVRASGFDPRDRYSYYCKVEVQVVGVPDVEAAKERASSALSHLLPEIMACLPDWVDVQEGRWPPKGDADAPADAVADARTPR